MKLVDKDSLHDDWLLAGSGDEPEQPLTAAERTASWEEYDELRREADIYFLEMLR